MTEITPIQLRFFNPDQARSLNNRFAECATGIDDTLEAVGMMAVGASFVIGTEASDVINVSATILDADDSAIEEVRGAKMFLSDASTGIGICATAPSGGISEGSAGKVLATPVAGKAAWIQTDANGVFDLDIEEAGALTVYAVIELPNGMQVVSDAITFAE